MFYRRNEKNYGTKPSFAEEFRVCLLFFEYFLEFLLREKERKLLEEKTAENDKILKIKEENEKLQQDLM